MGTYKCRHYLSGSVLVIVTIFDRILKIQSLTGWSKSVLLGRWFGWYPFLNPGLAFGIPLPLPIMIVLCAAIIGGLIWWMVTRRGLHNWLEQLGLVSVLLGAVSNVYDRVVYHATVDYFLILTGVFNIADFLIIAGFAILIWNRSKKSN